MKKSRHFDFNVTAVLCLFALSLAMALVAGCSSNAVAPSTDNSGLSQLDQLNSNITTGQTDPAPPSDLDKTVSGLIGPEGGVLQVRLDGSTPTIFRFPKGALKIETLITIHATVLETPSGDLPVYDCGPDGTIFDVPVEVTQPIPPGKTEAKLLLFNEYLTQWELQETSRVRNGCVKLHISHFSKYGIEASRAPIDMDVEDGTFSQ